MCYVLLRVLHCMQMHGAVLNQQHDRSLLVRRGIYSKTGRPGTAAIVAVSAGPEQEGHHTALRWTTNLHSKPPVCICTGLYAAARLSCSYSLCSVHTTMLLVACTLAYLSLSLSVTNQFKTPLYTSLP